MARVKLIYKTKKLAGPSDQDRPMRDAFKALDKENNGTIQEAELRQILGNLGDALTSQEVMTDPYISLPFPSLHSFLLSYWILYRCKFIQLCIHYLFSLCTNITTSPGKRVITRSQSRC